MFRILHSAFFMFLAFSAFVKAAPYNGNIVRLLQPDGSKVSARAYGDEYYQRIESLDGYTLVRDPSTGWISYASLTADGNGFVASKQRYSGKLLTQQRVTSAMSVPRIIPQIKLPKARIQEIVKNNRALLGTPIKSAASLSASSLAGEPVARAVAIGAVVGLTLLINFPDETAAFTQQDVDDYLNSFGYTGFDNNGSVREYFYDVSGGDLDYRNIVAPYYTAKYPKSYYTDPEISYGLRARELIGEALRYLKTTGFDFSQLTVTSWGEIKAINVLYAGDVDTAWSKGLWPHQGYLSDPFDTNGITAGPYQITNMGNELTIGTFCHENGHLILNWPDLYDRDTGYGSTGIGYYGLMAGGSLVAGGRNPVPPNPYFRELAGWDWAEDINNKATDSVLSHTPNTNKSYRYFNPNNSSEFFYIETRTKTGRNADLPDEGLMIWHIDTQGNNDFNEMTREQHFMVSLEQADAKFDLEQQRGANVGDLFRKDYNEAFTVDSEPNSRWWDGSDSGLSIVAVSEVGTIMDFTLGTTTKKTLNQCEFIIQSQWDTGLVALVRISNKQSLPIQNWELHWELESGQRIVNAWNANVTGDNPYSAYTAGWNRTIAPGEYAEFGVLVEKDSTIPMNAPVLHGDVCN